MADTPAVGTVRDGQPNSAADLPEWGTRNFLKNSSFNHVTADMISSLPLYWEQVATPTLTCDVDVPDAAQYIGVNDDTRQSLKIVGDADEGVSQTLSDDEPGQVYTLSGYVKCDAGTWKVTLTGDVDSAASLTGTDTSWIYFQVQVTLDSDPSTLTVSLLAGANSTTVYFDDVMLVRGDAGPRPWAPHKTDYTPLSWWQKLAGTSYRFPNMGIVSGTFSEATNPTTETFATAFAQAPVVVATVVGSVNARVVTIESVSASQFVAQVRDAGGTDQDETVHYIAIGPMTTET